LEWCGALAYQDFNRKVLSLSIMFWTSLLPSRVPPQPLHKAALAASLSKQNTAWAELKKVSHKLMAI